jgi:sugar/nucleoside kinase (ribokinase family)
MVLDPVLRVTDILLPNAAEAHALTGHPVLADAAGILARRGPLVVVKNGADGAIAHDGSSVLKAEALPIEPVDTVGAGDSFDAGFVTAVLRGFGRPQALAIAAACGSLSTRAAGGTAAQPDWDLALESAR